MASQRGRKKRGGAARRKRATETASHRLGLIGRDLADRGPSLSARQALPVLVTLLIVALGVAALRTELLRVRYALGDATLAERQLLDEERSLTARRRQLRDPVHLARVAAELGFVRPEHMIDVPPARTRPGATVLAAADAPTVHGVTRP